MIQTKLYRYADALFGVRAGDEWSAQAAAQFIGGYHLTPVDDAVARDAAMTIEVGSRESLPIVPSDLPVMEVFHGRCRANGERLYLEIDDSMIVVESIAAQSVRVWFGATVHARQPLSIATVLTYAVHAALRRSGLFELHAAGVMDPAGNGALIVGASGSGKSTLTLRLAAAGWRYLSDDRLVLIEEESGVNAYALRRVFSLTEQTLAACASAGIAAAATSAVISDPRKRHLEPGAVFPASFSPSCVPSTLFFTSLAGQQESSVTVLTPVAAMALLVEHCPWTFYDAATGREHLRVLARLAGQCRAYRLRAGRELLDDPERAAQLLERYVPGYASLPACRRDEKTY